MTTRRDFLKTTAASAAALSVVGNAFAGGNDVLKVGLIGCGGRGTGAADDCLSSSPNVKVVAIGDVFQFRVDGCKKFLTGKFKDMVDLPEGRCHVGLDAYQKVINEDIDLVLLATPPGFRPLHIEAAVKAGRNIFTEKPIAVDGPGVQKVLAAAEEAKKKKLAIVAGTQRRHQTGYLETMKRIHGGAIGEIVAARAYWNGGNIWFRKRETNMTDAAYQCHNWYHFMWICGDHIVEQHIHNLDVINWAMSKDPQNIVHPERAIGMGGRSHRPAGDPNEVGNIFDHFAVEYFYPNGAVMQSYCRQIDGTVQSVSESLVGTKGACQVNEYTINGHRVLNGSDNKPYVQEHTDLIASIRKKEPLNELKTVAESTLTAIMGRMATYTGEEITWQMALESDDSFPKNLSWDASLPVDPVPVPGKPRRKKK